VPHSSRSSLARAWSSVWRQRRRTADGGHLVAQLAGASLKRKGASLSSASQAFSAFPLTTRTPRLYTLQNNTRIHLHRLISARVLRALVLRFKSSRVCSGKPASGLHELDLLAKTSFCQGLHHSHTSKHPRWTSPKPSLRPSPLPPSNSRPPRNRHSSSSASPRRLCSLCKTQARPSTTSPASGKAVENDATAPNSSM
jgi:hypothetical protein